jgi:hypothetical protein
MEIKGESREDSELKGVYAPEKQVFMIILCQWVLLSLIAYQPVIYFVVN